MRFFYVFLSIMIISFSVSAKVSFEAGVNTEATNQNSGLAKQTAMNKAYREAFLKVSSRLTTAKNVKTLDTLTDEQLSHFIREVEVVAEKMTSNSYRADLNIKINENLLKQYLSENNMLQTSSTSNVLIIPIYGDTDYKDKVLFEDGNIWRLAWIEKGNISSDNIDFYTISDIEKNKELINTQNIDSIDNDTYDKLRFANGTEDIFVINAIRAGSNMLVINIKAFPKNYHKSFIVNGVDAFDKAIEQSIANITNFMQNKSENNNNQIGQLDIVFETKLSNWLEIEKKLNNIHQIKKVFLKSFSMGKAIFNIEFSSDVDNLIEDMARQGMYLQMTDGIYKLTI